MMNSEVSDNSMSSSSVQGNNNSNNAQSPDLKTYFKTSKGRYKLQYRKTHPVGLLYYAQYHPCCNGCPNKLLPNML
ncbi:hypothetical protein CQW23_28479 [Capsicum baccatum]|uniref:Uncharacterized protein n=1 Tax=Capsicum baccatum TaxID=33114 RepID=A0A2G2VGN9_CAPBA|nr:hypothetical protein CQW23_28479 [Capsicum baccatum]